METLQLTHEEREQMLNTLSSYRDGEHIDCDIILDRGYIIQVYGNIDTKWYTEPETGGTYAISRNVDIDVTAYDGEGNEMILDRQSEAAIYGYLSSVKHPMLANFLKTA